MLAITNAKVLTITQGTLEGGCVLIHKGRIAAVGVGLPIPGDARVIDATGKWVLPGLIDAHTHVSTFPEPNTLPGQNDGNEISSPVTPQLRAIDTLNPADAAVAACRSGGFTTCCTLPGSSTVIGGSTITFKTKKAGSVFDMVIPGSEHMKMALGENPKRTFGPRNVMPVTRMGCAAVLRETLFNARVYAEALDSPNPPKPDFKLEALVPAIRRQMKCRIHAHRCDDVVTAIRIAEEFDLDYSIEHASDAVAVLDLIAQRGVFCTIGPLDRGLSKMETWTRDQRLPAQMEAAGIPFCLIHDTGTVTRYLPIYAGLCTLQGLSEAAALEALTIRPARLLGLAHRVGSLEVGKDADIAIFSGNPLSNLSRCETTLIEGEIYNNL